MYICAINPSKCIQPFPLKIESDVQENYEKQSADGKKQNGGWNTYIYSHYRLTKKNSRCLRSARFLPEASSAAGWWKFCIGCIASKIWILKNWPGKGCSRFVRQMWRLRRGDLEASKVPGWIQERMLNYHEVQHLDPKVGPARGVKAPMPKVNF